MKKSIALVDFDGVVLKNFKASAYISKKVSSYVKYTLNKRGIEPKNDLLELFNKELYNGHGHTLIGMRNHGFNVSLREFNEYIYGDVGDYRHLVMTSDEKKTWENFVERMRKKNISIKLFSNSNINWMSHFIGYDHDMMEFAKSVDAYKTFPLYNKCLKPERTIYEIFMSKYPSCKYNFIDDKLANFAPISHDKRWNKIWIIGDDMNSDDSHNYNFFGFGNQHYAVKSLNEAYYVVCFKSF